MKSIRLHCVFCMCHKQWVKENSDFAWSNELWMMSTLLHCTYSLCFLDFACKGFHAVSMWRGGSGSVEEPTCQMVAECKSADASDVARANVSAPLMEAPVRLYPAMGRWGFGSAVSTGSWRWLSNICRSCIICIAWAHVVLFFILYWLAHWLIRVMRTACLLQKKKKKNFKSL